MGGGLVIFLIIGTYIFVGYKSRKGIVNRMKTWYDSMKINEEEGLKKEKTEPDQYDKEIK